MAAASFPRDCLTEDEIVSFFREVFVIDLKKEQLANPSPSIVIQLYEMMLEELGVSGIQQPDLTATQDIQNIERYVEFMGLSNIRLCVEEVLRKTGYGGEFTFLDFVQPKKKKVIQVLSRLIHLWPQADEVRCKWEENAAALDAKQKERERLHSRLQALQKSLDNKALLASQYRTSKAGLEKRLEAASKNYSYQKDLGNSLHEKYRAEKKQLVNQKECLSELEVQLRKLREEIAELENLIVRSPDKVAAETVAMEQQVTNKMSERRRLQHEYVEAMNQADTVMQAQKDLKPAMDTLRDTFSDLEVLREKCGVADDMKDTILSLAQKDRELDIVAEQSRENVTGLQNQVKKNRVQYKNQLNPLLRMNEDVKQGIRTKQEACEGSSAVHKQLLLDEMSLMQREEGVRCERQRNEKQFAACVAKVVKAVHTAIDTNKLLN